MGELLCPLPGAGLSEGSLPCEALGGTTPVAVASPESRAAQGHGGLEPISLCVGPGRGPNQPSPHRSWCQGSPGPTGLGAIVLCRVCRPPGGRVGRGRAQWVLCTTHLHPLCWGLRAFPPPCNPCVLYWTPGLLMGAGYPENPREAEHVPQGAPAPGLLGADGVG